ncbi:MAG: PQQ-dependent sugar dehydrogenase [Gemmatimonadota bacterium]
MKRVALIVPALALTVGCSDFVPADPGGGALEMVVDGLDQPVLLTHAPDDPSRLYIVEKPGRIRVVRDGALVAAPFLDIESITSDAGEQGLLGLAFHPDFDSNGTFFVHHTDGGGDSRILRFSTLSADEADASSLSVVLEVDQPFSNHNGGHIAFGPDDMLYIALGDGGSGGDPLGHGQNRETLLGSILRIDVSSAPYAVPSDNPFVGQPPFAPEIWVWGLRNPWRFSFDRETGDLWIGDVGQGSWEEVSFIERGASAGVNLGWANLEGSACYPSDPCDPTGTLGPVYEYANGDDGCSVTGGYVYRGLANPDFRGRYFFGDFCDGWVRSFFHDEGVQSEYDHAADFGTIGSLASFGEDASGELYIVSMSGAVYRVTDPITP